MDEAFVLEMVFRELVRQGLQLSVRDYQDALRALRLGHGWYRRDHLVWLCRTLWARTEDEARRIDLLFQSISPPPLEEIVRHDPQAAAQTDQELRTAGSRAASVGQTGKELGTAATFAAPDQPGLALPRAQVRPHSGETFSLTPQPIIPIRSLIVAWRRFRTPIRVGPKIELDLAATVAERCRQGVLATPVLRPARRNQARLTLLIDVSESMAPWAAFYSLLVESLHESRLGHYQIYYYHNTPEDTLYRQLTLLDPVSIDHLIANFGPSSLLIVGDGGAARRTWSRDRLAATRRFMQRVGHVWRPIAWLNPVPNTRWEGTTAKRISRLAPVTMFDLSEEHFIDAIDLLRGQRSK